jgi:protein translocase SecG subunit
MTIISIAQIIVSVLVIILVLIQERSSGLSGLFGGGGEGGFYQTRRGLEKFVFYATIFLVIVFAGLAVLNLII